MNDIIDIVGMRYRPLRRDFSSFAMVMAGIYMAGNYDPVNIDRFLSHEQRSRNQFSQQNIPKPRDDQYKPRVYTRKIMKR